MFRPKLKIYAPALLLLVALCAPAVFAQQQTTTAPSDKYVTSSGFKNRVFEVRNRAPEDLLSVLRLLTSGFKGAEVSASNEFHTIIVRDFPENIAAIEDALKRLDTPEVARPDIELRMHVLLASNTETALTALPADLKDVVTQLQSTLAYKNYYLLTSVVQRTKDSRGYHPGFLQGNGTAQMSAPSGEKQDFAYQFDANSLDLLAGGTGATTIQLGNFTFRLIGPGSDARVHSDVSMREGERVVVGTAGLKDKALIVVLTAKVVK
ncbi:MAG: secretin N-terminal domain-containing protein [Pyrinomonadaceae bacterium]